MTPEEIGTRTLKAMALREQSWDGETGMYGRTLRECFLETFGDHPMGALAYWAALHAWNDMTEWARAPEGLSPISFPQKPRTESASSSE